MRFPLCVVFLVLLASSAFAGPRKLQLADFEPLTSLPWKEKPEAKMPEVLDRIFRETNRAIRYPILAEYLRTIPATELGEAFDLCLEFEGSEKPNEFTRFFLPIWASRDPTACWKRVQSLFHLVGIEDNWLSYDGWTERRQLSVHDPTAIQASWFWLENWALATFPIGIDRADLPREERVAFFKDFSNHWMDAFGEWFDASLPSIEAYPDRNYDLRYVATMPLDQIQNRPIPVEFGEQAAAYEMSLRRLLKGDPATAPEIVGKAWHTELRSQFGTNPPIRFGPSTELLVIWAQADLPRMIQWAETTPPGEEELIQIVRGFLMSRVDAKTRDRWLAAVKTPGFTNASFAKLLQTWAAWDPAAGMQAAISTRQSGIINDVIVGIVDDPWQSRVWNTHRAACDFFRTFEFTKIPPVIRQEILADWSQMVMEFWGDNDIAETAKHGVKMLFSQYPQHRSGLLRFFGGEDVYPDNGGMIDRTFCALRVWAITHPVEMKSWIATLKDRELQKALTWLCEHPAGTGPLEDPRKPEDP